LGAIYGPNSATASDSGMDLQYTTTASWASETSTPQNDDFGAGGILVGLFSWQAIGRYCWYCLAFTLKRCRF